MPPYKSFRAANLRKRFHALFLGMLFILGIGARCEAQSIPEVLRAVQERRLALIQREAVQRDLERHAHQANGSSSPLPPVYEIDDSKLIDWGYELPRFPNAEKVNQLKFKQLLSVLNKASKATDLMRECYLNLNPDQKKRLYDNLDGFHQESAIILESSMTAVRPPGAFTESNWREKLAELARYVECMKALNWPLESVSTRIESQELTADPAPQTRSSGHPGFPFITEGNGICTYQITSAAEVGYRPVIYSWTGSGESSRSETTGDWDWDYQSSIISSSGIRSLVNPVQTANPPLIIGSGTLAFYKKVHGEPTHFAHLSDLDALKTPGITITYWEQIETGLQEEQPQGNPPNEYQPHSLVKGSMVVQTSGDTNRDGAFAFDTQVRGLWGVGAMDLEGEWKESAFGETYQFGAFAPEDLEFSLAPEFAVQARCVCFPQFTAITGNSERALISASGEFPGTVQFLVDGERVRINLGRGLYDRAQTANIRFENLGSPTGSNKFWGFMRFNGGLNAFRVLNEANPENYQGYPLQAPVKYDHDTANWWYHPRIRQIYGADAVVDIEHHSDHKKTFRFYYTSEVTLPADNVYEPQIINAQPYKTVVVEFETAGLDNFDWQAERKLRVDDAGLHYELSFVTDEEGSRYLVKAGSEAGEDDLFTRTIKHLENTELVTQGESTMLIPRADSETSPFSIRHGDRSVEISYHASPIDDEQDFWFIDYVDLRAAGNFYAYHLGESAQRIPNTLSYVGPNNWELNGTEIKWTPEGALLSEKHPIAGKTLTRTYAWTTEGVQKIESKLDGSEAFNKVETTYSDQFRKVKVKADGATTETNYHPNFGVVQSIVQPGGFLQTLTISPSTTQTIVRSQSGWKEEHLNGTDTWITTNEHGGLVTYIQNTTSGIPLASVAGSEHTIWGAPKKLEYLRGEEETFTYNEERGTRAYGRPTSAVNAFAMTSSVTGYDLLNRPIGINTEFTSLTPDYTQLLKPKVTDGEGKVVSAELNELGEATKLSDSRGIGSTLAIKPGEGSLTIGGREISLQVNSVGEVLGIDSGLGSRGQSVALSAEGFSQGSEKYLCVSTTGLTQSNADDASTKTYFDGRGRVVAVKHVAGGGDGSDLLETWTYDDSNRTVTYSPGAGPLLKSRKRTISEDGATTIFEEAGSEILKQEYSEEVNTGGVDKILLTTSVNDDSGGTTTPVWRQLSVTEATPESGSVSFTPWDLAGSKTTLTTTPAGATQTTTLTSGGTADTLDVVQTNGRVDSVQGTQGGSQVNLSYGYVQDRLSTLGGAMAGQAVAQEFDPAGRTTRVKGPGYDKTVSYSGTQGYKVDVHDANQHTDVEITASAVGDFTGISGDGVQPLAANTVDLGGGQTKTTFNGSVEVLAGLGGILGKEYAGGIYENIGRNQDWSPSSFGSGPEAAAVAYGPADKQSTTHGTGANAITVVEDFYKSGPRKDVLGVAGDSRSFLWNRGLLARETHQGGVWSGVQTNRFQDSKGQINGVTIIGAGSHGYVFTHDTFNRPSAVSGSMGGGATYGYAGTTGLLDTSTRSPLLTTHVRDGIGRVTGFNTINGSGPSFSYTHQFNDRHLRTSRLTGGFGSSWTGLTYDNANRLRTANVGGRNYEYFYDARGNRTAGGNVAETWTVNGLDQVTGRTLGQRGYGVTGTVAPGSQVKVYHPGAPQGEQVAVNPQTGAYAAAWLASPNLANGGVAQVEILVRGTLPGAGQGGTDAVADLSRFAVVPAALETFEYDGAGRLVGDSNWIYTWNAMGHLIGMTRKPGTSPDPTIVNEVLAFTCDSDGRRVMKVRGITYRSGGTRTETSKLLWDGWIPVMEERTVDGASLPRRWFVWGRDVSGNWDGAGGIGGLVAIEEEGGRILLPVDDGLGNIMAVVDKATGNIVAQYDYGPYGEPLGQSGDAEACPFRYQSKFHDGETGLSYFGYRYYSPKMGRWISRDPLGEAGGFNLYGYCGNDPVNRRDLLGMLEVILDGRSQEIPDNSTHLRYLIDARGTTLTYRNPWGLDRVLRDASAEKHYQEQMAEYRAAIEEHKLDLVYESLTEDDGQFSGLDHVRGVVILAFRGFGTQSMYEGFSRNDLYWGRPLSLGESIALVGWGGFELWTTASGITSIGSHGLALIDDGLRATGQVALREGKLLASNATRELSYSQFRTINAGRLTRPDIARAWKQYKIGQRGAYITRKPSAFERFFFDNRNFDAVRASRGGAKGLTFEHLFIMQKSFNNFVPSVARGLGNSGWNSGLLIGRSLNSSLGNNAAKRWLFRTGVVGSAGAAGYGGYWFGDTYINPILYGDE